MQGCVVEQKSVERAGEVFRPGEEKLGAFGSGANDDGG